MAATIETATPALWSEDPVSSSPGWLWHVLTAHRQALGAAPF
ncbi:MAG TPA: hypothetical protein VM597_10175 [Gemmataceae bacterium]|jgi:hypothetical protein|nr:hypothetical protein [Gemmataceae bacterium]